MYAIRGVCFEYIVRVSVSCASFVGGARSSWGYFANVIFEGVFWFFIGGNCDLSETRVRL